MNASDTGTPRLIYLLPRYNAESAEHIYHLYGFLRELKNKIPLHVLVEAVRGERPEDLPMHTAAFHNPVLRFWEEFFYFLGAGLRGTRTFYVHYSYSGAIAAALAARWTGGKTFYWNCGMYAAFTPPRDAPLWKRLREGVNRWLLETSVRMSTHLVTGTPRMAEYYARHVNISVSNIRLLPNFVDADRFRAGNRTQARETLGISKNETVLLYLHRVAPRKGAHYLPGLAARITRALGPVRMLVAGDGPYLPVLRQRAQAEGVNTFFDFRGWVPNRDVPLYFRAADLYIMPSDEEGFPRVLLEAMAAECPFVAFDVGGVRDILAPEQAECMAAAGDMDDFARRCKGALQDPAAAMRWRRAGTERVALFSQARVLTAFQHMIDGEPLGWASFLAEGNAS